MIPEGLIEFIPEMKTMIANLNDVMSTLEQDASYNKLTVPADKFNFIESRLEPNNAKVFESLPVLIKAQLLMDRDRKSTRLNSSHAT